MSTIRKEKENHFIQQIDKNKRCPKKIWKEIKNLIDDKYDKITEIEFEDQIVTSEKEIANKFNTFFLLSITDIINDIEIIPDAHTMLIFQEPKNTFNKFENIEMNELNKTIKNLANKNGTEEGITTEILKISQSAIGDRFLNLINTSMKQGIFPTKWKTTTIVPIHKIKKSIKCSDFRPINILPQFEKVIECVVRKQILKFCDENNLIAAEQSGFRENHSCESQLQLVISKWKQSINNGKYVIAVFLDFKRAFETINRNLLLFKLRKMGFKDTVLNWFQSYLTDRFQKVRIGSEYSSASSTSMGVPQGSVLGPTLFLLYINDIVKHMRFSDIQMFADDTMLYICGEDPVVLINFINEDLNNVYKWLCVSKMKLNTEKTKGIIFGTKHMLNHLDINMLPDIKINNETIYLVKEMRYLGIIVDNTLNLKAYIDYLIKKTAIKTNYLSRCTKHLSVSTKLQIYKSLVFNNIDYCSSILFGIYDVDVNKIQKVFNRALRNILKCSRDTPIKSMLDLVGMMSVKQRLVYNGIIFIHKIIQGLLPNYLSDKLKYVNQIHNYETRGRTNIFIETNKQNISKRFIFSEGFRIYNKLDPLKKQEQLNSFKKYCNEYVKENF